MRSEDMTAELFYKRMMFLVSNSSALALKQPELKLTHGSSVRLKRKIKELGLTPEIVHSMTPSEFFEKYHKIAPTNNPGFKKLTQNNCLLPNYKELYGLYLKSRDHSGGSTNHKLELTIKNIYDIYYCSDENRKKAQDENLMLAGETYFYRKWREYEKTTISPTFRKQRVIRALAEFDFTGVTLPCNDGTKAQFAVLVLDYSRKCYVEAIASQGNIDSAKVIVNGFKYFGGVTDSLAIDNFKAAVKRAGLYGGEFTKTYEMLAQFLGVNILSMKVRKGNLKGTAEAHVKIVTHTLLSRMKQRILDGEPFANLKEMNDWLLKHLDFINDHKVAGLALTRNEMFKEEQPLLYKRKNWDFNLNNIDIVTVPKTARITVHNHEYCVRPTLIGRKIQVETCASTVNFYEYGRPICSYKRLDDVPSISTKEGFNPDGQLFAEVISAIPHAIIFEWAEKIGVNTHKMVKKLLKGGQNIDKLRRAIKLLTLCRGYSSWYSCFDEFVHKSSSAGVSKIAAEWKVYPKPESLIKDPIYSFEEIYSRGKAYLFGDRDIIAWPKKKKAQQQTSKGRTFMNYKGNSSNDPTSLQHKDPDKSPRLDPVESSQLDPVVTQDKDPTPTHEV